MNIIGYNLLPIDKLLDAGGCFNKTGNKSFVVIFFYNKHLLARFGVSVPRHKNTQLQNIGAWRGVGRRTAS